LRTVIKNEKILGDFFLSSLPSLEFSQKKEKKKVAKWM